ncbi:uncharacterized protein BDZ83DRAFT_646795 [Colletotrichum acutatum]|uniref:Uncharacterized protein n=1 Tax=Glomerella acutata TaxID=27357 RepID=A0AAD8XP94_GLOAC|nr:uncharacterized protein BDZ83DRAFT_646795 [Colletotrichum acutatum]KAK1730919.1 hypothetical protein BDZ83DRAFT_646795 [Colletotrichum acutatum]
MRPRNSSANADCGCRCGCGSGKAPSTEASYSSQVLGTSPKVRAELMTGLYSDPADAAAESNHSVIFHCPVTVGCGSSLPNLFSEGTSMEYSRVRACRFRIQGAGRHGPETRGDYCELRLCELFNGDRYASVRIHRVCELPGRSLVSGDSNMGPQRILPVNTRTDDGKMRQNWRRK